MYKLIQGSIFDGKCDLLVIPCNNEGGISRRVKGDLLANGLPRPHGITGIGDVSFCMGPKEFTISSYIAFACTVKRGDINHTHTKGAVGLIVDRIIEYCRKKHLRKVNFPLIGTGEGGLSVDDAFGTLKERLESVPDITANIFVLADNIFRMLNETANRSSKSALRVFVSYAGQDADNKEWTRELCIRLRNRGLDVRVDMFDLYPGKDFVQWMTNEIILADKVILICDKYYHSRIDPKRGGVGWEGMIIQGDMVTNPDSEKYICIVREEDINQALPLFMRTKYAVHCTESHMTDSQLNELIRGIESLDRGA